MDRDARVYLVDAENFAPAVQPDGANRNCARTRAGEDWFHRIATAEIYLTDGTRDFCLNCALALGIASGKRPALPQPPGS